MKIGIHERSGSFSEHWIEFCKEHDIEYKPVDCYRNDILEQLDDCDVLMWHWHHGDPKAVLFARQLTFSLEAAGKAVYPNSNTAWHFDDKVGQKYLLEAIDAPCIPSYIFYDKAEALQWAEKVSFPKVFKLRGGAGSINVKLVKSKEEALRLIGRAFNQGFSARNRFSKFRDRVQKGKTDRSIASLMLLIRGLGRLIIPTEFERLHGRERGYIYFQDFLEGNTFDTRVVVIGDRCFTIRRYNRENDFRASGSGKSGHSPELFDKRCLKIAFDTSERLGVQSMAYDFVFDSEGSPKIVEMSYAFVTKIYPGHWDVDLNWHEGECNSQYFLMQNIISQVNQKNNARTSVIS